MKTSTPSCSALAQNGWNFGSLSSSPLTLPPMAAPRSPYFFTPSSSCWAARSGYCSATEANATKRSGLAAQAAASFSFWILMSWLARSRSALYQYALMLSASTSIPCSSMARIRSDACVAMSRIGGNVDPGVASFIPMGHRLRHLAVGVNVHHLHAPAAHHHLAAARLRPRGRCGQEIAADEGEAGQRAGGVLEKFSASVHRVASRHIAFTAS